MEDISNGIGEKILTIAIAAGWVAVGALILRVFLAGVKTLFNKLKND